VGQQEKQPEAAMAEPAAASMLLLACRAGTHPHAQRTTTSRLMFLTGL